MFKDRDGWRVQWVQNGQRRSKKFKEQSQARRFEMELELGIADTQSARNVSPTFDEFSERWLTDYCQVEKAESHWLTDRRLIRRHLSPDLGGIRLVNMRKAHLVELKSSLSRKLCRGSEDKVLSAKSVNNLLALAKKMMATAVDLGLITTNPFQGVKPLKLPPQSFLFWKPEERDKFLAEARPLDQEFTGLVLVACHTGLRMGELAALSRSDLDFERQKIRVSRSFNVNLAKITPTKNREMADVPMNRAVTETLAHLANVPSDTLVFSRRHFWSARKRLRELAEEVGVSPIRFHDLRHTFASTLAMAGVDLLTIQQLCRHKSYQMTLRYAHLHPEHLKGATEVLCTQTARKLKSVLKSGGPRGT